MPDVQTNNPGAKTDRDIPQAERDLASSWTKRITAAKKEQKDRNKKLAELREYVNGKQHTDGQPGLVRTNLIFATLATLLPYVYAKNPDISISPTEAVDEGQYEAVKRFCKTLEIVLHRLLVDDAKLKKRAKSDVRAAMTTGLGWLKVLYQRDFKTDPIIQNRIADIQDNIARISYLADEVKEGVSADQGAKKAELEEQMKALRANVEVVASEGLVIDRIMTEDMLVLDPSVRDFDMYAQARALAHAIWFEKEGYGETFGHDAPKGATTYKKPNADDDKAKSAEGDQEFVRVWEIWDRKSQTVYTMAEGATGFCRPPYQPGKLGARWYPFFALGFNPVDGQFEPLSDVELLKELQDEYNTTRTNFAEHRKENLPGTVVRAGGQLTPEDIERIKNRKINDTIVVEGDGGRPLSDDIVSIGGTPIDASAYDVTPIRNDMDLVAGTSDASRSNLILPKTLGEAEIMKEAMMSRTSERQDTIEDMLQEVAQYSAEMLLQELTPAQVQRIAGPGYTWPVMSKDEIFDLVKIEVRAGSTGKPNRQRERQQWVDFLPELKDAIVQVGELRKNGQPDVAQALVEMLKETVHRFDERIDVESFLPKMKGQTPEAALLQAAQDRIAQLEQQIQALESGDQVKYAGIQAEIAMNTQDNDTDLVLEAMKQGSAEGARTQSKTYWPQDSAAVH